MKDFDLTRQNWQRAKVQAECVLPSPETLWLCKVSVNACGMPRPVTL